MVEVGEGQASWGLGGMHLCLLFLHYGGGLLWVGPLDSDRREQLAIGLELRLAGDHLLLLSLSPQSDLALCFGDLRCHGVA